MPPRFNGTNQTVTQISERFDTDRFGIDSIEYVVKIPDSEFPSQLLADYSPHPRFTNMQLSRRSGARAEPGWWTVSYIFEGFLISLPDPTYELITSLSQEPIQTHPDFSTIAGAPAFPVNGAIFIDPDTGWLSKKSNAVFKEFSFQGGENPKAGIDSYLVPGAEFRETKFQETRPTGIRDVGTIDTPSGQPPSVAGRDWLAWSETYIRRGGVYQVSTSWKLSGRNGWDPDIYEG